MTRAIISDDCDLLGMLSRAGLSPAPGERLPLASDNAIRRYRGEGDKDGRRNCWIVANDRGGAAGSWRTGARISWGAGHSAMRLPRRGIDRLNAARAVEEAARWRAAAEQALVIWNDTQAADPAHPYLVRKSITPLPVIRQRGQTLIVPMLDPRGTLANLQRIYPNGDKLFLKGGRTRGCSCVLPGDDRRWLIAEGFATAASLHAATGHTTVIAFSAANLKAVAIALRDRMPTATITICADNDSDKPTNTGIRSATEAARAIGAALAVPGVFPHA